MRIVCGMKLRNIWTESRAQNSRVRRRTGQSACRNSGRIAAGILLLVLLAFDVSAPTHAFDYPNKLQLIELLRSGEIAKLERRLAAYQSAFENGRASDALVEAAYFAFANSDQTLARRLDDWVDAAPESYIGRAARGVYYWRLGWIARGSDLHQEPSRQQARAMRRFFRMAEEDFEAAIDGNPRFSLGYAFLISIAMASNQRDDPTFMMRRGLKEAPHSFAIREWYLASLEPWWRSGRPDKLALAIIGEFVEATKEASKLHPELTPLIGYADYARAQMLFNAGHHDKALGAVDRALARGDYWRYHELRGRIQLHEQRCVSALNSYDRALARNPQAATVYGMRGHARQCIQHHEAALEDWDRALELDAMDPNYLLAKGETLQKLGRHEDARDLLDKAIFYGAYDPSVRAARGALLVNYFDRAEAAIDDLDYATQMAPDRATYWRDFGDALFRANRCDAAAALATYLRLCERGAECIGADEAWAAATIEDISRADCQG